jgi:hypothetical protein
VLAEDPAGVEPGEPGSVDGRPMRGARAERRARADPGSGVRWVGGAPTPPLLVGVRYLRRRREKKKSDAADKRKSAPPLPVPGEAAQLVVVVVAPFFPLPGMAQTRRSPCVWQE